MEGLREARMKLENLVASNLDGLNAWEVTQYFRGELFIMTDFLFGANENEYTDEALDEVIDFFKCVLRCIVIYLRRLEDWEREFNEMVSDPDLFFVCP